MKKVHPRTDSNKVCRDVERVGNDQRTDEQSDNDAPRAAESDDHEFAEPFAGRERSPIADLLHASHQRKGEERHPQHPKAKLRARLRIGGDARRVVV